MRTTPQTPSISAHETWSTPRSSLLLFVGQNAVSGITSLGVIVYGCRVAMLRVEPCGLSEGLGYMVPRLRGTALGWFHRAAITLGS
ncbi:hypothetical protein QVD17_25224 [Tagetes erecta]|uniref:Uncharacterized protein n=1 Tax=Tagetes erecta TaxID=13708 RepID=A0AAD8KJG4_TARER|nr:hypothetical protein QVD17_25224 [Tagetes erecta]